MGFDSRRLLLLRGCYALLVPRRASGGLAKNCLRRCKYHSNQPASGSPPPNPRVGNRNLKILKIHNSLTKKRTHRRASALNSHGGFLHCCAARRSATLPLKNNYILSSNLHPLTRKSRSYRLSSIQHIAYSQCPVCLRTCYGLRLSHRRTG